MDVGWLALAEDSDGDEDVEFDHGSELSLSKLPLKNLFYSDDEDDDADVDEEGAPAEQPAKKKRKKMPFYSDDEDDDADVDEEGAPAEQPAKKKRKKMPFYSDDEDDDADVDEEGAPAEQPAKKKRKKMPVDSDDEDDDEDDDEEGERPLKDLFSFDDEDDDEDDDKEGAPAEQPAKKKKKKLPTRCPVCGVWRTQLARHIMAKHKDWSKVKAQNFRYAKNETKSKFRENSSAEQVILADTMLHSVAVHNECYAATTKRSTRLAGLKFSGADVDYEPIEDVSKRRRKRPLKDFVSSAEAVAEKVPERGIPADEPAGKKKRTRCPVCGVWSTQLARHIMAKHQDWSKVKAQNVRYANIETKRKRFECPTCLTRVVNLKRHLVQMHDVQPGSMQELHLLAPTSKRAQTKLKVEILDHVKR
ncbi:hypothetical protein ACOMHN_030580 [Nucella lapillus]